MRQERRRLWNLSLLAAGATLVMFAAVVLVAIVRSTTMRETLTQNSEWSAQLNEALVVIQTHPPTSDAVDRALQEVLGVAVEIQSSPLADETLPPQAKALEDHTRVLQGSLNDPSLASYERTQLFRVAGALDRQLHELSRAQERSMQTAWVTVQVTNIGAIALAIALVLLLAGLRKRALAAEAMQVRLESALAQTQRARERERQASRAKSDFLATVSHEIRTPLNAILGSAELLDAQDLSPVQTERVGVIRAGGEALLGLIDAVLDLSRIESGDLELRPRPFPVRNLLEETIMLFTQQAAERGLELNLVMAGDIPPLLGADPDRLRQVLVNLLGNAIKFTPQGEVQLRATWGPDGLLLEVQDTGPGIPVQDQSRILRNFTQLHQRRDAGYGGVGLGLPISLKILQAMGGGLSLESAPGRGSTFRARVPATPLSPPEPPNLSGLGHVVCVGLSASVRRAAQQLRLWRVDSLWVPSLEGLRLDEVSMVLVDWALRLPPDLGLPTIRLLPLSLADDPPADEVTLALPLRPSGLLRALAEPPPPPTQEHLVNPRLRVLVVDDHAGNLAVMRDMLEALDSTVLLAPGGQAALDTLERESVDLVFMDVDMPDIDGLECTRRLRARGSAVPILGLSGHATSEAQQAALAAGMDDYLTKPVRLMSLRQALNGYQRGRR